MDKVMMCPDWEHTDENLMSNFDHEVNQETAQVLKGGPFAAPYTAWNFYAMCWFADEQFHAEVSQYHAHMDTLSADTPEELMEKCSDRFGED